MQRKDGNRGANGRFAKKSGAGEDAGATAGGELSLGSSGELVVTRTVVGDTIPTLGMASPDRPGIAAVDSVADLEREVHVAVASAPIESADPLHSELPQTADPAGPSPEEVLTGYTMICTELIDSGCNALIPAWQVTAPEVSKLSTACAKALMLWFPDMIIPPKYLALLTIAGVGFEIAQARKEPSGGYRPARLPERAPQTDQAGAAAPAH